VKSVSHLQAKLSSVKSACLSVMSKQEAETSTGLSRQVTCSFYKDACHAADVSLRQQFQSCSHPEVHSSGLQ